MKSGGDMERYLKETNMLDFSSLSIRSLIEERSWLKENQFERIRAIYNFVRDEILFGYNRLTILKLRKFLKMDMANVTLKEHYLWPFYVDAEFLVEYMALR